MKYTIDSNLVKVSRVAELIDITDDKSWDVSSLRTMRTFILVSNGFDAPVGTEFTLFIIGDDSTLTAECIDANDDGLNLLRLRGEQTEGFRAFEVIK